MQRAIVLHLEHTHNLAEHAGAATLAAALKIKDRLAGRKVVLVMSGGNITVDQLQEAIRVYRNG
jgi:threonine dehydratase